MLSIQTDSTASGLTLRLKGTITEESVLPALPNPIAGQLVLDLEGVSAINSIGCRNWALWMKDLNATGGVLLQRCSPVFVHQMNVLVGFVGQAKIASVFLPYYCESCGDERRELIDLSNGVNKPDNLQVAAAISCPVCKAKMEIDVDETRYFSFLSRARS